MFGFVSTVGNLFRDKFDAIVDTLDDVSDVWSSDEDSEIIEQLKYMLPEDSSKFSNGSEQDKQVATSMINEVHRLIWDK